ncbi:MAG: transcriptional regulator [Bacteroidales bacterium]|nr:transcriptional regulator [Bacteroidales bacterium]
MFKALDPLLHNQLRLSIMSILISVESAEFSYLLDKTGATRGNISVQINKLKGAGYISVKKSFRNNYPLTTCKITTAGIDAFENYVDALSGYINKSKG